jgi:hypothetical protein
MGKRVDLLALDMLKSGFRISELATKLSNEYEMW